MELKYYGQHYLRNGLIFSSWEMDHPEALGTEIEPMIGIFHYSGQKLLRTLDLPGMLQQEANGLDILDMEFLVILSLTDCTQTKH